MRLVLLSGDSCMHYLYIKPLSTVVWLDGHKPYPLLVTAVQVYLPRKSSTVYQCGLAAEKRGKAWCLAGSANTSNSKTIPLSDIKTPH